MKLFFNFLNSQTLNVLDQVSFEALQNNKLLQITFQFDFCCANVFDILYNKRSHAQQLSNNIMFLGTLFLFTLK